MSTEFLFVRKFRDGSYGLDIRSNSTVVEDSSIFIERYAGKVEPRHHKLFRSMTMSTEQRCFLAELLWRHGEQVQADTFMAAMGTCPTATVEQLPSGVPVLAVPEKACCEPG